MGIFTVTIDYDKLIAEQMEKRRHHFRCAQECERIPIMAKAKATHEAIAMSCGSKIRELCAKKKLQKEQT
jgi:hypothetical protein